MTASIRSPLNENKIAYHPISSAFARPFTLPRAISTLLCSDWRSSRGSFPEDHNSLNHARRRRHWRMGIRRARRKRWSQDPFRHWRSTQHRPRKRARTETRSRRRARCDSQPFSRRPHLRPRDTPPRIRQVQSRRALPRPRRKRHFPRTARPQSQSDDCDEERVRIRWWRLRCARQSTGVFPRRLAHRPRPARVPEKNYPAGTEVNTGNGWVEDNVPDDQSLVFNTSHGLVLLSGCGHSGIINTLQYARGFLRPAPVDAAIGGFHLFAATDQQLAWTAGKLKEYQTARILGAHCTGIESVYRLRELLGLSRQTCLVGTIGAVYDLNGGIKTGKIAQ